ncbi:MAG TPA: class III signal peptide-containing protein [archaeon]|nr:class III signal peptide-containing protein [archaeon]HPV66367.1 class III signal peptide-containing protein [archaeon]
MFGKKGQVSIEVLIILALLIVGGVIFGVYYVNHLNSTIASQDDGSVKETTETFVDSMNSFSVEIGSPVDGQTYSKNTNIRFTAGFVNQKVPDIDCNWSYGTTYFLNTCSGTHPFTNAGSYNITIIAKSGNEIATDSVTITIIE